MSNVLNRPEKVLPATRDHVLAVIDDLGFVRNDAARQLRAGTNRAVGMIVLDVRNPFFTDVAQGVEERLGEHRRPLILGNSGQDARRESTYLDLFEEQRVSGLLITPVGQVLPRLRRLRDRGTAVVVVDRRAGTREFSSVAVDDKRGGRIGAQHLVDDRTATDRVRRRAQGPEPGQAPPPRRAGRHRRHARRAADVRRDADDGRGRRPPGG